MAKKPPDLSPYVRKRIAGKARAAQETSCTFCGTPLLTGDDSDTAAAVVKVETEAVDWMTEVLARVAGRQSYTVTGRLYGPELDHRSEDHLQAPADRPVLLSHRCPPATRHPRGGPSAPGRLF
jgi:hypothetical protein